MGLDWFGGCGAGEALGLAAAELAFGAEPIAVGRLAATEELVENVGAEGVGDDGGAEGVIGGFLRGHESADGGGFENGDAALLPVAADEGVYEFGFDDAFGAELLVVLAGDFEQFGFVLAGDDAAWAPCLRALKQDEALPSAEREPVDFSAMRRLAWI